ncbi:MAG: hypothetical protein ACREJX_06540 [Polyangiaceae bacterium]
MSWVGFSAVYTVTCAPSPPPVAFRMTFAIAGLAGEIVANVRAIVALSRRTENATILAMFLPWVAMGLGFGALGSDVFSRALLIAIARVPILENLAPFSRARRIAHRALS